MPVTVWTTRLSVRRVLLDSLKFLDVRLQFCVQLQPLLLQEVGSRLLPQHCRIVFVERQSKCTLNESVETRLNRAACSTFSFDFMRIFVFCRRS